MGNIEKVNVNGWELEVGADDEPRVRDIDLGERLGFARPSDVRKLVKRMLAAGILSNSDLIATVARCSVGNGATRSVTEYHLTETGALLVIARSDAEKAVAITREMVAVFVAYRRGLLQRPETVRLDIAHGPRVGELPELRAEVVAHCVMVSRASKQSIRAIHGYIRRLYRVPGVYHLTAVIWPLVKQTLTAIALRPERLAPPRKALPADRRQLEMWKQN